MRTRLSVLLALIAMPLVCQDPPPEYAFRGTVVGSDGAPADGALVECVGSRAAPVIANSKGEFTVRIPHYVRVDVDMSRLRGMPRCRLRASLAGFEPAFREAAQAGNRLILHPRGESGGSTVSATSLLAPPKARGAYEKGRAEVSKQRWEPAEAQFRTAVKLYPEYASAWNALGNLAAEKQDAALARECWGKAVAIDPKYLEPSVSLARMAAREERWADVWQRADFVLRANPGQFPEAAFLATFGAFKTMRFDQAVESGRHAVSIGTHEKYPQVLVLLGYALAKRGAYAEAVVELRRYLEMRPEAADAAQVRLEVRRLEQALER